MAFKLVALASHPIQYFAPLFAKVAASGVDLTVLYCSRQGLERYVDEGFGNIEVKWDVPLLEGYRSEFLPNVARAERVGGFFSLVNPAVVAALRRIRPDALWVHGHNSVTNMLAIAAAQLLRIPVLMRGETHLLLDRSLPKRALRPLLIGQLYRRCAGALAIGSLNREFYRAHGVPEERIFDVPYTIDNQRFAALAPDGEEADAFARAQGLDPARPIALFCSKMQSRKRAIDLVEAHAQLRAEGLDCQLALVGDGEERAALERVVAERGIEEVLFAGFRNQRELPSWYAISDVFVLPSDNEPWGLIVNEVMAVGVPVVATSDVGSAYDLIVEGETGYVYPAGEVAALARRLGLILRDPSLQQQMAQAARARMASWSYDQAVAGIHAALEAL